MDAAAEESFGEFVAGSLTSLLRFGHVLTGDSHRAEDLVQTALARTWSAWPRIVRQDEPARYVRKVMVNAHASWWRRRGRRETAFAQLPDSPLTPSEPDSSERAVMWAALAQLPPRQRAVHVLRYYESLSEAEIADVLGCAPGTVKSQAARGLSRLREIVGAEMTLATAQEAQDA